MALPRITDKPFSNTTLLPDKALEFMVQIPFILVIKPNSHSSEISDLSHTQKDYDTEIQTEDVYIHIIKYELLFSKSFIILMVRELELNLREREREGETGRGGMDKNR